MKYFRSIILLAGSGLWLVSIYASCVMAHGGLAGVMTQASLGSPTSQMSLFLAATWIAFIIVGHVAPLLLLHASARSTFSTAWLAVISLGSLACLAVIESTFDASSSAVFALPTDAVSTSLVAKFFVAILAAGLPTLMAEPLAKPQTAARASSAPSRAQSADTAHETNLGHQPRGAESATVDAIFHHLVNLRAAAHQKPQGLVRLMPDGMVISQGKLAPALGISKATLCRRLQSLSAAGRITTKSVESGTLIILAKEKGDHP
jgi:biotin operon repressor